MDANEQAARVAEIAEQTQLINAIAETSGRMRDAFMANGFRRDEAVALTAEWLSDMRHIGSAS